MHEVIRCDARASSTLDWSDARKTALSVIATGKKILWLLDFGLFNELQKPINHPGQFSNFTLAIDHFQDQLWKEFRKFSIGVALYQGNADFLPHFPWDEVQKANLALWMQERYPTESEDPLILQLFARDVCVDYLEQLALRLPDAIPAFVILDQMPEDKLLRALLTDPERYGKIQSYEFSWNTEKEKGIGIYMPDTFKPSHLAPYQKILMQLQEDEYKLIPEEQLIASWHGLNKLYVYSEAISASGKRKIQGFIAAGGEVLYL